MFMYSTLGMYNTVSSVHVRTSLDHIRASVDRRPRPLERSAPYVLYTTVYTVTGYMCCAPL